MINDDYAKSRNILVSKFFPNLKGFSKSEIECKVVNKKSFILFFLIHPAFRLRWPRRQSCLIPRSEQNL